MVNGCEVEPTRYRPPGVAAASLAEYSVIPKIILDAYV